IFWQGLKKFIMQYRGRHADWSDIEQIFAEKSGQDLRWFFRQWVEQAGAPVLSMADARGRAGRAGNSPFEVEVSIAQVVPPMRVSVPIRIRLNDRREETVIVPFRSSMEKVVVPLPALPTEVELDPDYMVFRRIDRDALPPVLNHYVTDSRRTVVMGFTDQTQSPSPFRDVLARIQAQDSQKPEAERTVIVPLALQKLLPRGGSVLLLGDPEQRSSIQSMIAPHCGARVDLRATSFAIEGTSYEGPDTAVLLTGHPTEVAGGVLEVLLPTRPAAVARGARRLV